MPARLELDGLTADRLRWLYSLVGVDDIAALYGCSYGPVVRLMDEYQIPRRGRSRRPPRAFTAAAVVLRGRVAQARGAQVSARQRRDLIRLTYWRLCPDCPGDCPDRAWCILDNSPCSLAAALETAGDLPAGR